MAYLVPGVIQVDVTSRRVSHWIPVHIYTVRFRRDMTTQAQDFGSRAEFQAYLLGLQHTLLLLGLPFERLRWDFPEGDISEGRCWIWSSDGNALRIEDFVPAELAEELRS